MKVTEYERIAEVNPNEFGQFPCPKCKGMCFERTPGNRRQFDCTRCERGWLEIPDSVKTVSEALDYAEEEYQKQQLLRSIFGP